MKIVVRKDLCCAAQLCVQAAPDLFRLDELGYNDAGGEAHGADTAGATTLFPLLLTATAK